MNTFKITGGRKLPIIIQMRGIITSGNGKNHDEFPTGRKSSRKMPKKIKECKRKGGGVNDEWHNGWNGWFV